MANSPRLHRLKAGLTIRPFEPDMRLIRAEIPDGDIPIARGSMEAVLANLG